MLPRYGFAVRSSVPEEVISEARHVPAIEAMRDISAYFLATATTAAERADAWARYDAAIDRTPTAASAAFDAKRMYEGVLAPALAETALAAIRRAPREEYRVDDAAPDYVTAYFDDAIQAGVNQQTPHRDGADLRSVCRDIFSAIRDEVAAALGSPWRVPNYRCFVTPARAGRKYSNAWHHDNFVSDVFKIMVYLTPRTREFGGIEFRLDDKEIMPEEPRPGSWVLFHNSGIVHRGVPGEGSDRAAIEITICRAPMFPAEPMRAGVNDHYPHIPPT